MFVKGRFSEEHREGYETHEDHGKPYNEKEEIDKFFPRSCAQKKKVPLVDESQDIIFNQFINNQRKTWGYPYPTN